MRQALLRRRQYIALYRAVHAGDSGYARGTGLQWQRQNLPRKLMGTCLAGSCTRQAAFKFTRAQYVRDFLCVLLCTTATCAAGEAWKRSGAAKGMSSQMTIIYHQQCMMAAACSTLTMMPRPLWMQPTACPVALPYTTGAEAVEALKAAEATMTVCETVTHRIFVGLHHSRQLLRRPALWQHWLEVLDGLGGFVDLVPGRGPGMQQSDPGEAGCVQIRRGPTCSGLSVESISQLVFFTGCRVATVCSGVCDTCLPATACGFDW